MRDIVANYLQQLKAGSSFFLSQLLLKLNVNDILKAHVNLRIRALDFSTLIKH